MQEYINNLVLIYLNNKLVYSTTIDEHKVHLCKVFDRLHENKMQSKLKKCKFEKPHMKYLGDVIGSGELHVDMDKVAPVRDLSAPVDIKGV